MAGSELLWNCHQSLMKLAEHNRGLLLWVPRHRGTEGNETADEWKQQLQNTHPIWSVVSWRELLSRPSGPG
jgi:ribonuclease HI